MIVVMGVAATVVVSVVVVAVRHWTLFVRFLMAQLCI